MVHMVEIERGIFLAPQLVEADFAQIAARGIRAVVNNRPDGEAEGQLANDAAQEAAFREGLVFRSHPVDNIDVTDEDAVDRFAELLDDLPRPILFYCRSGTRCSILWAQARVADLGVERTIALAGEAGFDLDVLREELQARAAVPDPCGKPVFELSSAA